MKQRFNKPFLSVDQQLQLIESRGIQIADRELAVANLRRIGYYRLSGYWYPFRRREAGHREGIDIPADSVRDGIHFEDIVELSDFDRRLRNLILSATEPFETAIRVAVAQTVGDNDPFAYVDESYWGNAGRVVLPNGSGETAFEYFARKQNELQSMSKEAFATHFRDRYDGPMPIWMAIELWDFGMLSRFYSIMPAAERATVANGLGLNGARQLQGWLLAINDLRNVCAHHSRLYRRHFPNIPAMPKNIRELSHVAYLPDRDRHRVYPMLCVLAFVTGRLPQCEDWAKKIRVHFGASSTNQLRDDEDYGFPLSWSELDLWSH